MLFFLIIAIVQTAWAQKDCPAVDEPPRDLSCRWEGIRDPETNCIVDWNCAPTEFDPSELPEAPEFPQLPEIEPELASELPEQNPLPVPQNEPKAPISSRLTQKFEGRIAAEADFAPNQWKPARHGEGWRQPQARPVDNAQPWQNPQPAGPPIAPSQFQWQQPQPVAAPAPQPAAPQARPQSQPWLGPGRFNPGPRGDGQAPACPSVHVPPTNYRCAGWTPEYDPETGCIDHYECIPAPPVPHIPPQRPCPNVPKPKLNEQCRWQARVDPRTGCKAYYECRPVNTPGSFCPIVPFPRPVSRCNWSPVFNRDTGCVILYKCEVVPDCPVQLGGTPAARDGCIWTVVTDEKGCDSEYKCVDHGGLNDAGIDYAKTSGESLIKEVAPCDPRDPHVCTGWREPMEWGCCANYRDFPKSHFRWHNRGCYCEPNRRRCVIERTVPGEEESFNDQWTYCVPKETFDCYNNFFLKGALCGESR